MKSRVLLLLALLAFVSSASAQGWFRRQTPTPLPVLAPLPLTPTPTPPLPPRELVALPVYDETTSVRL
jgi:hypothetical protein